MKFRARLLMILICMLLLGGTSAAVQAEDGPSVVVHFKMGQSFLSAEDKSKLRVLFRSYVIGPQSRVFVLGYTDATGDSTGNYRLSRKRAQSVRREIISDFGIGATIVMAMGKGEESPVADNRKAQGRALNRRAEIYLANTPVREPVRVYGAQDPLLPTIQSLVQDAELLIKKQQFNDAIQLLDKARAKGGDHYSDWHAAYGIAGYYAGASNETIRVHFSSAVRLDPYNFKAREFLSRAQARQKVVDGEVSGAMGRTVETAIPVTAVAQEYEYLRLFGVEPLNHLEMENKSIDVWRCLDEHGAEVVYYFNHAGTYAWAFAQQVKPSQSQPVATSIMSLKSPGPAPVSGAGAASIINTVVPADPLSVSKPSQIWESKVFN